MIYTTSNNYKEEVEYDDVLNKPIFGWTPKGKPVYKPRVGISKMPPKYRNAGVGWRKVLTQRLLQANTPPSKKSIHRFFTKDEISQIIQNKSTQKT